MKILTDILTEGLCKCHSSNLKKYTMHDVTFCTSNDMYKYDYDTFDMIYTHVTADDKMLTTKAKIIYSLHVFHISCPYGGFYCLVLNKFLEDPLTCLNCLGYLGIKTGETRLKKYIRLAKRADIITVDSNFMKEFYHAYDPVYLPVPMETDVLTPCSDKENYILYTGRLSFEKNPYGFVDIINKTGLKGKMIIYNFLPNDSTTNSKRYYKEILENTNKNIEIFINPSKEEMIELVKHAKFTVLPYLFAEPFGIASLNSVLCGTPLVAFPYGNSRNMTHLLPKTLDEIIQLVKMDDKQYQLTIKETLKKSDELRDMHDPVKAVKKWDKLCENLMLR